MNTLGMRILIALWVPSSKFIFLKGARASGTSVFTSSIIPYRRYLHGTYLQPLFECFMLEPNAYVLKTMTSSIAIIETW